MEVKNAKIYAEVVDGKLVGGELRGTGAELIALAASILDAMAEGEEEYKGSDLAGLVQKILEDFEKQEGQA